MIHSVNKNNCYGCGMCEIICPQKNRRIERSADGFYTPHIKDKLKCANCDLCKIICPYSNTKIVSKSISVNTYSAFSKDKETVKSCSSGGISYEIGKYFIHKGYKACGVKYNYELNRAEHFVARNIEELELTKGSKYLQSYTIDGFKELNSTGKWIVFGTPCQIDSIRRWIKLKNIEQNYILIDNFCHGVPSYLLWEKYLKYQAKKYNIKKISGINFRDKIFGWHNITISLSNGCNKINNSFRRFDLFYSFFLSNVCLNSCCYEKCQFKNFTSSADLRVGDLWGEKYAKNNEGVSAIVTFTDKGEEIIEKLKKQCVINIESPETIISGQTTKNLKMPLIRDNVIKRLSKERGSLKLIFIDSILPKMVFVIIPKTIFDKSLNLIKKIL